MTSVRHPIPGVVYPPAERSAAYIRSGVMPEETLVDALARSFKAHASRVALSDASRMITYRELDALSDRLAVGMLELGLAPRDAVLIQLPNGIELAAVFIACLKAGLIPVCTLLAHRASEITAIGNTVRARAHVVPAQARFDYVAFSIHCRETVPSLRFTLTAGGEPEGEYACPVERLAASVDTAHAARRLGEVEQDFHQVAVYQLSGGTTGTPKVIPRFHNDYLCNLRHVIQRLGYTEQDRILVFTPMLHNAPFICTWGSALLVGAETVAVDGIEPRALLRMMDERQPTIGMASEAMMARASGQDGADTMWKSFRLLLAGRGTRSLEAATGVKTCPFFGMTEGVICFGAPEDGEALRHDTVGYPICADDEFKILEVGAETELPDGEIGELAIRGPYTLHGYMAAPERNAEAFTRDGFYRSGDLMARVVVDGKPCLRFHGRLKDVIDRGGEKISCEEVEQHMLRSPRVTAVAVVPMPDPDYRERACAFVVPDPVDYPLSLSEIQEHLREVGLAKFKWPERIELLPALPLTASGKPAKAPLRDRIRELVAGEAAASRETSHVRNT